MGTRRNVDLGHGVHGAELWDITQSFSGKNMLESDTLEDQGMNGID
jgi:hypothetical protein